MSIVRRAIAATSALIISLALIVGVQATAAQANPPSNCAAVSVCGYANISYKTDFGYEYIPGNTSHCEGVGLNDRWSSAFNNTGRVIYLYKNAGCPSGQETIRINNGDGREAMPDGWDNKVSSVRIS